MRPTVRATVLIASFAVLSSAAATAATAEARGLVAHYALDEGKGTAARGAHA